MAAVVATQALRDEGTVISQVRKSRFGGVDSDGRRPRFCPKRDDGPGKAISFYLPRDDELTVTLVRGGESIRTLATRQPREGGRRHCFPWDGLDDAGRPAPPGFYRLRVTLERAGRTATAGKTIEVKRKVSS